MKRFLKTILALGILSFAIPSISAQNEEVIQIPALFEYPTAPENIEGLMEKSNWLVAHFWDPMDFRKSTVDQTALDHAFQVYCTPVQYAEKSFVDIAIRDLVKKLEGNPTLLYQFTIAAENNLFGPRAVIWADEVYVPFLETIVKNRNLSKKRLEKYKKQLSIIKANSPGTKLPAFTYFDRNGKKVKFAPAGKKSLIVFTTPGNIDAKMYKVKLSLDSDVQKAIEDGSLNLCFFTIGDPVEEWMSDMADYPREWIVGASPEIHNIFDVRVAPAIFLADEKGNLINKNLSLDYALSQLH